MSYQSYGNRITYTCQDCERKYPNRADNTFGNRKAIRKHLQEVHGYRHTAEKPHHPNSGADRSCGCLAKNDLIRYNEISFSTGLPVKPIPKNSAIGI